ncbi:hypothetical protein F53441_3699 [Fusarium austroafricanum]|uniref:Uncharacterized protein n=1 Tax=Fusarium austroafricanum TaxID=2364996 RepID=A0A8H4NZP0_9HYPO|nr:hypothetical protein F53441_3699 [Fusarium austroafricanum]
MFVYQGKLNWYHYAKDETFVIVLPSGPVRVGDTVYLFSQWTEDSKGNKKVNWFSTLTVETVTQTQAADVTFYLKGSWYNFTITTKGGYEQLSVVMRNPNNGVSDPMALKREWKSDQELTGTTRIWTGKFKWMNFAQDEHAIFIVPDGFGEGKPILSTWQWTRASSGKTKDPSFRSATQTQVSGLDTDTVKFTYTSYYTISCTWDGKKDQLDVWVQEGGHKEDVGDMVRSAIIERQVHSHDFDPPEKPPPSKNELEVRLPQTQASLPRILTPMPFPKGLLETLAHTAAFVDQAGYLAKYAQDHFAALDADYHIALDQIKSLKAAIANLEKTRDDLTVDRDAAQAKAKKLEEDLNRAHQEIQELQQKIAKLQKEISDDALKDAAAQKMLDDTRAELKAAQDKIADLTAKLSKAEADRDQKQATIEALQKQIIDLENTILQLKAEITVKDGKITELTNEKTQLTNDKGGLEKSVEDLRKQLARAKERIAQLEADAAQHDEDDKAFRKLKDQADLDAATAREQKAAALKEVAKYKKWAYDNNVEIDISGYN